MRTIIRGISLALLFLAGSVSANAALPLTLYLSTPSMPAASEAWPTMQPQPLPKGLRPCCAFGYDLRAELLGLPIPFYQLNNVVTADSLGHHQYNDHLYSGLANLTGLSGENNGIVYTLRVAWRIYRHRARAGYRRYDGVYLQPTVTKAGAGFYAESGR